MPFTKELETIQQNLLSAALAENTHKIYNHAWQKMSEFQSIMGIDIFPMSPPQFGMFIAFLVYQRFAASTIRTYISGISYYHKLFNVPDNTKSFFVAQILKGLEKTNPRSDVRQPITLDLLIKICDQVRFLEINKYDKLLLQSMFSLAFFALTRISEITSSPHNILLQNVTYQPQQKTYNIKFHSFKHSVKPVAIFIQEQYPPIICPVKNLTAYIQQRGSQPGPVFLKDKTEVNRNWFYKCLKTIIQRLGLSTDIFKAHSFRIGGATYAAFHLKLDDHSIQRLGRWRSSSFKSYIR